MANPEHLAIIKRGVDAWNDWRRENLDRKVGADLSGSDLSGADLSGALLGWVDLKKANLSGANLSRSVLNEAKLRGADLSGANLSRAVLPDTDLGYADLSEANLSGAVLPGTRLRYSDLSGADLTDAFLAEVVFHETILQRTTLAGAELRETTLADLDLSRTIGLEQCVHLGPSIIDHRTLQQSGPLPLVFLRGVGLPDSFIDSAMSPASKAGKLYSCFISYLPADREFAERLHADLQDKGVRCWFAPLDRRTGVRAVDEIHEAARAREKMLVILSQGSVASEWTEHEVRAGLEEEREGPGRTALFPIRLDDAVLSSAAPWAVTLCERHIGDFTRWRDHDAYRASFERLLRDLTADREAPRASPGGPA